MSVLRPSKSILVYDADCGPCSAFKELVSFLDFRSTVAFVSLRRADAEGLVESIPERLRYSAAHLLLPDGTIVSGAEAMVELCGVLPGGRLLSRFVASWVPARRLSEFLYSAVSRLHDTGGCRTGVSAR